MDTIRIFFLAAALACSAPLHAQGCSGGPAGGSDATGNQCNAADMASENGTSRAQFPQLTAKMDGMPRLVSVNQLGQPVAPVKVSTIARTAKAEPVDRFPKTAMVTAAPVKTAKITVEAAECSGGSDGGMDSTGNQCNNSLATDTNTYGHLAGVR